MITDRNGVWFPEGGDGCYKTGWTDRQNIYDTFYSQYYYQLVFAGIPAIVRAMFVLQGCNFG